MGCYRDECLNLYQLNVNVIFRVYVSGKLQWIVDTDKKPVKYDRSKYCVESYLRDSKVSLMWPVNTPCFLPLYLLQFTCAK